MILSVRAFTSLPDPGAARDFVSGSQFPSHLRRLGHRFLRRPIPLGPNCRNRGLLGRGRRGRVRIPQNVNSNHPALPTSLPATPFPPSARPNQAAVHRLGFFPKNACRARGPARRRRAHRPRTAACARDCGVCGRAGKIARRAVCSSGWRRAVAAMHLGWEGKRCTGSCPALFPPPLRPHSLPLLPCRRRRTRAACRSAPHGRRLQCRGAPGRQR